MRTISQGSILILAFHLFFVGKSKNVLSHIIENDSVMADLCYILLSCTICILFIPVIRFVKKHIPLLIGGR